MIELKSVDEGIKNLCVGDEIPFVPQSLSSPQNKRPLFAKIVSLALVKQGSNVPVFNLEIEN